MELFDYEQYQVIGLVENKFGDNATIDVIGYCDDNYYTFNQLDYSKALNYFLQEGKFLHINFLHAMRSLKVE